jgi:hypothetical protein
MYYCKESFQTQNFFLFEKGHTYPSIPKGYEKYFIEKKAAPEGPQKMTVTEFLATGAPPTAPTEEPVAPTEEVKADGRRRGK